jgi:glycosyltransferase involved in cell wall biosynthesis
VPKGRTLVINRGGFSGRAVEVVFKSLGIAPGFFRNVRAIRPSLIHAHFGMDGVLALPLARALAIPLIVTFHGVDVTMSDEYLSRSDYPHRRYLSHRRALQREAHLFLAVSNFIASALRAQGFPAAKIIVHYIGVDTTIFRPDPGVAREPLVLFVGRLVEKKGCAHLIRAMARVQDAAPGIKLLLIGDGPLRGELERLAQHSLRRYEFLGTQPVETVRAWMNRAKVFCGPSVTAASGDAEGFGLVFAEAQAMGLPVVSSHTGGVPEAVAHEQTGLLVKEGDEQALAHAIERLLSDAPLWNQFSVAGSERVGRLFDLRKQTTTLEDLYMQVLKGSDRAPVIDEAVR